MTSSPSASLHSPMPGRRASMNEAARTARMEESELDGGDSGGGDVLRVGALPRSTSPVLPSPMGGAEASKSAVRRGSTASPPSAWGGSGDGQLSASRAQAHTEAARALPLLRQEVEALSVLNQQLNDALEEGERFWGNEKARLVKQVATISADLENVRDQFEKSTAALHVAEGQVAKIPQLEQDLEAAKTTAAEVTRLQSELAAGKATVAEGARCVQEMAVVKADIDAAVQKQIEAELEALARVRSERDDLNATLAKLDVEKAEAVMKLKKSVIIRVEQDNAIRELKAQVARGEGYKGQP